MRLFLLENYTEFEFDLEDTQERENIKQFAKKHCSKAINEFWKKNIFLHRGIDNVSDESAYVVPTKPLREPFGTALTGNTFISFNDTLRELGHVPRDKNVAFATTQHPQDYNGVQVDEWFFFLPIGDYRYSYLSHPNASHDFNMADLTKESLKPVTIVAHYCNELSYKTEDSIASIVVLAEDYKNTDAFKFPTDLVKQTLNVIRAVESIVEDANSIYRHENTFDPRNLKRLSKIIYGIKDPQETAVKLFDQISSLVHRAEGDEEKTFYNELNDAFYTVYVMMTRIAFQIDYGNPFEASQELIDSYVTDKITDAIKDNEIVFQCEKYLMIPFIGHNELIAEILGQQ